VFPSKLRELARVAERSGIGERPLDFFGAGEGGR
jgi:hypothetical protein